MLALARIFTRELQSRSEIQEPQNEITECYVQISDDFEEITLLRSFSEHLELSEVHSGAFGMSRKMLPLLCRATKAETVVMILESCDATISTNISADLDGALVWGGPKEMDSEVVTRLVG